MIAYTSERDQRRRENEYAWIVVGVATKPSKSLITDGSCPQSQAQVIFRVDTRRSSILQWVSCGFKRKLELSPQSEL